MRRQSYLITPKPSNQQGFALFIVLMMMIVIAFLVVASSQAYNTEQRISSNNADRNFTLSLAEEALRAGEDAVSAIDQNTSFTANCDNGLCSGDNNINKIDSNGAQYSIDGVDKNPRYIIERIATTAPATTTTPATEMVDLSNNKNISLVSVNIYRVTAKAWGKNRNTTVTLQSYVAQE